MKSLDEILGGGLPLGSVNVVSGASGTGKTILCQQIAFHNAGPKRKVLYLSTLSEPMEKLIRYQQQFAYFDKAKLDKAVIYGDIAETILTQGASQTIDAILVKLEEAKDIKVIVIDSFKAVCEAVKNPMEGRALAYNLAVQLAKTGCTSFLIGEYSEREREAEPIFAVADGIIELYNQPKEMDDVRLLKISKMRGGAYFSGLHAFGIDRSGITVYPRTKTPEVQGNYEISQERVETGVAGLDEMLHGGIPRGTATLVAGGAGTGKTVMGLHFICHGIVKGEPGVIVTFQEPPSQFYEMAKGFGWDLQGMEKEGVCKLLYASPVELNVDKYTAHIKETVGQMGAQRIVIDSLVDLETATPNKVRYKDYVYSLVNWFKSQGVTSLLTNEIAELFGSVKLTAYGVSFIADNVILLRYVELASAITRAIAVLKMRGSGHDKALREFRITSQGMDVLEPFAGTQGLVSGTPTLLPPAQAEFEKLVTKMSK